MRTNARENLHTSYISVVELFDIIIELAADFLCVLEIQYQLKWFDLAYLQTAQACSILVIKYLHNLYKNNF